jgi:hypothetical protein
VRLTYDLDDDRDVLKLERLTETAGFDFEQVAFLEGESVELAYTGDAGVPRAHRAEAEGQGSAVDTFRTELQLLARELARAPNLPRRGVKAMRTATTRQLIVGVILFKKLLIAGLLVWLLV